MTKLEVVQAICERTGLDKATVSAVVEGYMQVIHDSMVKKENVYLRGFGTFVAKRRAAKTARNITKNTTVEIPERYVPLFKASDSLVEEMNA